LLLLIFLLFLVIVEVVFIVLARLGVPFYLEVGFLVKVVEFFIVIVLKVLLLATVAVIVRGVLAHIIESLHQSLI
jgi:hypothetical protein